MRNQLKTFYSALLVVATLGLTTSVHGVPAFARQTGLDCTSCHAASGFPTLNAFGAAFKAGGYSQANEDNLMGDGEALSIPKTLNMSVVLKAMNPFAFATVTPATGTATKVSASQFTLPDEMAFLVGGRLGKNSGFLIESNLGNKGNGGVNAVNGAKYVFAPELGPVRLGIVPWWSDLGAGYVFETMSTGAINNIRPAEELKGAAHRIGMNGTDVTGLGLYIWHPMGFIAFTPYFDAAAAVAGNGTTWFINSDAPGFTDTSKDNIGYYFRAAATPSLGAINLGIGVQYWAGKIAAATVNAFVVDAQAMMDIGIPLSVYVTYGMNTSDPNVTPSSLTAMVDFGVVPDVFMAGALFALDQTANKGAATNTSMMVGVAAKYHFIRNLKVELDVTYTSMTNDKTSDKTEEILILPMIFGAF